MRTFFDSLRLFAPALLLALGGFLVAYQFVDPAPPDRFVLATASPGGAYHAHGKRYRDILARDGVSVELRESAGSLENLEHLRAPGAEVRVAFVQGGTAKADADGSLVALASLYFEPLWLFHRAEYALSDLSDLTQARIAIGAPGSGTRAIAVELLTRNGIDVSSARINADAGAEAAAGLIAGQLDAMFLVSGIDSDIVRELLAADGIRLMSFNRADAYTRHFRHLSSVTLPQGAVDLERDLPDRAVTLIAPAATLVARRDFHPALIDLLMLATEEVHRAGGMFEDYGQFPSPKYVDLPVSEEAQRYYESGQSFLRRVMPFWAATLVERLLVMLVPLIALMIPLVKIMPPVYRWRIRSRIYRWYRQLLSIDPSVHGSDGEERIRRGLRELARIEEEVARVEVPLSYADQAYALRVHIELVRDKLNAALERGR